MKNIHDILKGFGIEIPADKKAEFDKAVSENYRLSGVFKQVVSCSDT